MIKDKAAITRISVDSNFYELFSLDDKASQKCRHQILIRPDAYARLVFAEPWILAGGETFIYVPIINGQALTAVTVTNTLVGAAITAAALAIELATNDTSGYLDYDDDGAGNLLITSNAKGSSSGFRVTTGTLNAIWVTPDNTEYFGITSTSTFELFTVSLEPGINFKFNNNPYKNPSVETYLGHLYGIWGRRVTGATNCDLIIISYNEGDWLNDPIRR